MALPNDLTTVTISFGPYVDSAGGVTLVGKRAKLFPVNPATGKRLNLVHVATGQEILPVDLWVTVGADGTGSVGPVPHTDNPGLSTVGFAYRVEWDLPSGPRSASPGNKTFAVPAAAGATVDFNLLEVAEEVPGIYIPVAGTADATVTSKGRIQLAGDLAGTAEAPTVPGLATKVETATYTAGLAGKVDTADPRLSDARTPTAHTHPAAQVSDATTTGRAVLTATDAAAARSVIGAGTSSLVLGTTAGTAKAGDFAPTKADVGLGNVDNTADTAKPVSTAQQTAIDATKARANHTGTQPASTITGLASVATSGAYGDLTGTPTIPPAPSDASTTVKGIVELATNTETTTGTDTARAVTPAGLKVVADTKRNLLTPETQGALVDGTTNDAAAFLALMGVTAGQVDLGAVTPAGASTPAYLLSTTVDVPATKSLRGDGYRSRVRIPADGGTFTGGIIFRLNTTAAHGWVQSFPGVPATTVGNFIVHALEAGAAGNLRTAFEFGGSHKFSELWVLGIDQAIKQIDQYCDAVKIERLFSWMKPDSANYLIDLPYSGDAVEISQIHVSINNADDYRPKILHLKFKNGAAVRGVINGDILVEHSRPVLLENLHMEYGQVTLSASSGRLSVGSFYMRNRPGQKVTPVVVSQPATQASIVSGNVTLEDLVFPYTNGLTAGYPIDGTPNLSISGNGATPRLIVQIRNLHRLAISNTSSLNTVAFGVTCGDPVFDDYSHLASLESTYSNGVWKIAGSQVALSASVGIDVSGSAPDSFRSWQAASGTYYYKVTALMDSRRLIGRVGSAEESQALTNGGNGASLILDVAFRRAIMLRVYRGTSTGSYDKYVDVPLLSAGRLHDSGLDIGGYPWISRTAGAVDTINTDIDAGLDLTPGETTATSDAYGHAVAYARTSTAPPTVGSWRRGDRVLLVAPVVSGASRLMGWVRLTDCTSATPAHVMGTDWAELRSPTS